MSPVVKMLSACAATALIGMSLLALANTAEAHPHEKQELKQVQKKIQKKIFTDTETLTSDDLNEHFEQHARKLREAMNKMKTESRIIVKQFDESDEPSKSRDKKRRVSKRIKIIENPEELRSAARSVENLLADSGLLQSLADVVIEIAEDIEIEDMGDGMRLSFDGKRIGGFSLDEDNHSLSIESLGNNTTIEKETFIENGKTKTRIVIETDSDDIDLDVIPNEKKRRRKSDF